MSTFVAILTFMRKIDFSIRCVEHEKKVYKRGTCSFKGDSVSVGCVLSSLTCLSMRGSRNFHERGSNENGNFWSQARGGGESNTPPKSRNYLF